MRRPSALGVCLALAFGCAGEAKPSKPMGLLPSATTTAEPEWMPPVVHAGRGAVPDARETHLDEPRRLTQGWDVEDVAWSPDGRSLAVVARSGPGAPARLWHVPLGAGSPRALSAEGEAVRSLASSREAPWRLVYVAGSGGDPELKQSVALGAPEALDVGGYRVDGAALSPDGGALFFVGEGPAASRGVFAADGRGKPPRVVATERARGAPAVSPDRSYVAWAVDGPDDRRVVVASVEGRSPRVVASTRANVQGIAFVPKTRKLLFSSDLDTSAFEIYAVDLAAPSGSPLERVTFSQGRSPSASHDGRMIAFASRRGGETHDLYIAGWIDDP